MKSLRLGLTPHRRVATRFIGSVRRKLQKALADNPEMTQSQIAEALGIDRSVITRQLRGTADLSVGRVAEIACVLGYEPDFNLVRIKATPGQNAPAPSPGLLAYQVSSTSVSKASTRELIEAD